MFYITHIFYREHDDSIMMNIYDSTDNKEEEISLAEYNELQLKMSQGEISTAIIFPPLFNYTNDIFKETVKTERQGIKLCEIYKGLGKGFRVIMFYYDMKYHFKLYNFDKRDSEYSNIQNYKLYTFIYYKDILILTSCTKDMQLYSMEMDKSHTLLYLDSFPINEHFSDAMLLINKDSVYDLVTDIQHEAFSACPVDKCTLVTNTIRHRETLYRNGKYAKKPMNWSIGIISTRPISLCTTNTDIHVYRYDYTYNIYNYKTNEEWQVDNQSNYEHIKINYDGHDNDKILYEGIMSDNNRTYQIIAPQYRPKLMKAVEQAFKEVNKAMQFHNFAKRPNNIMINNVLSTWFNYKLSDMLIEIKNRMPHDITQVKIDVQTVHKPVEDIFGEIDYFKVRLVFYDLNTVMKQSANSEYCSLDLCNIKREDICFLS